MSVVIRLSVQHFFRNLSLTYLRLLAHALYLLEAYSEPLFWSIFVLKYLL